MPPCHPASPNATPLAGPAVRPAPSAAARRMRRPRLRRQKKLRWLGLELRETEITALIRRGYLTNDTRNDLAAVKNAFYRFLDQTLT
jgi:glycine/D-amino acid oxidase-like deaminating enzyme